VVEEWSFVLLATGLPFRTHVRLGDCGVVASQDRFRRVEAQRLNNGGYASGRANETFGEVVRDGKIHVPKALCKEGAGVDVRREVD
jgi:hypothetical protein